MAAHLLLAVLLCTRRQCPVSQGIPLEGLLRLLAGQRVMVDRRDAASSNEELIAGLKRTGMLQRYHYWERQCCSC